MTRALVVLALAALTWGTCILAARAIDAQTADTGGEW